MEALVLSAMETLGGTIAEDAAGSAISAIWESITKQSTVATVVSQLQTISTQLTAIKAEIEGVAAQCVWLKYYDDAFLQISNINGILQATTPTAASWVEIAAFLTPPTGATITGATVTGVDYHSLSNALIFSTYGITITTCLPDPPALPPPVKSLAYGSDSTCQAYNSNAALLPAPITSSTDLPTITSYVGNNIQLAVTVSGVVAGLLSAAYAAFTALYDACTSGVISEFVSADQLSPDDLDAINVVLNANPNASPPAPCGNGAMPSDLVPASGLAAQLMPYILAAPEVICGQAYAIYNAIYAGGTVQAQIMSQAANSCMSVSFDALSFEGSGEGWTEYWTLSFVSPQAFTPPNPQNGQVIFVANLGGSDTLYLCIAELSALPTKSLAITTELNDSCYWNLLIDIDPTGAVVFFITNVGFPGTAMANNHGSFEPNTPGCNAGSNFDPTDPDNWWSIVIQSSSS